MSTNDVNIITLEPREQVRKRPGMWISTVENPNHLLIESFSNALDEKFDGFGNRIIVNINDDNSVSVQDFGRGFEINKMRDDDKTVAEAAVSVMLTSGKYDDESGAYSGSIGAHGAGEKAVNYLSTYFDLMTVRDKKYEHLRFEKGILTDRAVGNIDKPNGTTITYLPDDTIFDSIVTDKEYFNKLFNDVCYMCNDLVIVFNGKEIHHDSIEEALDVSNDLLDNHFVVSTENINLAMTYTTSDTPVIKCFVNCGEVTSGVPLTQIKSSITRILNNFAKEQGILSNKDKNLTGSSLQEGLRMIFNVRGNNIVYDSQSKHSVSQMDMSKQVDDFTDAFILWLDTYPDDGKKIIEKAVLARKASEAAKKARANVRNKAKSKNNNLRMPSTLVDCHCKDRSKAELFIVEGKAASGGLIAARNSTYQSIYSVRGMMLSVLKTKPENIIKNKEINNLLTALGLDFDPKTAKCKYDKDKLRYGKIIAAADGDEPGALIRNLMFNIFWYICPELVTHGHIYTSMPPLFRVITKKNEYIYLKDNVALAEYKKNHYNEIQSIGREKG